MSSRGKGLLGLAALLLLGAAFWLVQHRRVQPVRTEAPSSTSIPERSAVASSPEPNSPPRPTAPVLAKFEPTPALVSPTTAPPASDSGGSRIPFPVAAPYAFSPVGFRDTVDRAIRECHLPYTEVEEDCSEYPCIVSGDWDTSDGKTLDMAECRPWKDAFGENTIVSMKAGADGKKRASMVPYPEGADDPDVALQHLRTRMRDIYQAYKTKHERGTK